MQPRARHGARQGAKFEITSKRPLAGPGPPSWSRARNRRVGCLHRQARAAFRAARPPCRATLARPRRLLAHTDRIASPPVPRLPLSSRQPSGTRMASRAAAPAGEFPVTAPAQARGEAIPGVAGDRGPAHRTWQQPVLAGAAGPGARGLRGITCSESYRVVTLRPSSCTPRPYASTKG